MVISFPDTANLASLAKGNTVSVSNGTDTVTDGVVIHLGDTLDPTPVVVQHSHPVGPPVVLP